MENQKISSSDEIDLQELFIRGILFIKRHFKFISFSIGGGIILAILTYIFSPKVYESRMIVMSDILTESYSKEITKSLENLIKEKNNSALATLLSLSENEANFIKTIEIESVKKENTLDKTEQTIFIITANIKNKEVLPKLQNGLILFLRNNEFVKIRVKQRKEMNLRLIEKIGSEISSLDSLKRRLFAGLPVYSKGSEMLLVDPTNIYSKIIELNKEQINYKNALELADSIQLVEGFTVFQKPSEPKLYLLLAIGIFGGFFVSIGLQVFNQYLKLANSKL